MTSTIRSALAAGVVAALALTACSPVNQAAGERLRTRLAAVPGVTDVKLNTYTPEESFDNVTSVSVTMSTGDTASIERLVSEYVTRTSKERVTKRMTLLLAFQDERRLSLASERSIPATVPHQLAVLATAPGAAGMTADLWDRLVIKVYLADDSRLAEFCAAAKPVWPSPPDQGKIRNSKSEPLTCP